MSAIESKKPVYFDESIYDAAKTGNLSKIKGFIALGGWVDMPNAKGKSMFFYACKKGQVDVVEYLMDQGAHTYYSLSKKNGLEKASEQVKKIVNDKERKRNEVTALVHDMSWLIGGKAANFKSAEESIQFINCLQPKGSRQRALKDFAYHFALDSIDPFSLFKLVHGQQDQLVVAESFVHAFLTCGDIPMAKCVLKEISVSSGQVLKMQIELFSNQFEKFDESMKDEPQEFKKMIEGCINHSNIYLEFPKETLDPIIQGMAKGGSLTKALEFAKNEIKGKFRGFALSSLPFCGLEELAISTKKDAEKDYYAQLDEVKDQNDKLLQDVKELNDFSASLEYAGNTEDQLTKDTLFIDISYKMCALGFYETGYKVFSEHIPEMDDERIDDLFDAFKRLLTEENPENEWAKKFLELKPK